MLSEMFAARAGNWAAGPPHSCTVHWHGPWISRAWVPCTKDMPRRNRPWQMGGNSNSGNISWGVNCKICKVFGLASWFRSWKFKIPPFYETMCLEQRCAERSGACREMLTAVTCLAFYGVCCFFCFDDLEVGCRSHKHLAKAQVWRLQKPILANVQAVQAV